MFYVAASQAIGRRFGTVSMVDPELSLLLGLIHFDSRALAFSQPAHLYKGCSRPHVQVEKRIARQLQGIDVRVAIAHPVEAEVETGYLDLAGSVGVEEIHVIS
jgi:hypothetical protein